MRLKLNPTTGVLDIDNSIFGESYQVVVKGTQQDTTSQAFVNNLTLNAVGLNPGSFYRINWQGEYLSTSPATEIALRVQLAGIETIFAINPTPAAVQVFYDFSGFFRRVINSTTIAITLDFASSLPGKSVSIKNSRIDIWRTN